MGASIGPEIYCPSLRKIKGLDCVFPGCRANAFCTGYVRPSAVGWAIEYECPDCGNRRQKSNPVIRRLGERLSAAGRDVQDDIAESFVRSRPESPRPFSAPWPEPPE